MGAMIGTKDQKDSFMNRLDRIKAGGENTTQHIYVGPVEEAAKGRPVEKKGKAKAAKLPSERGFFSETAMIPVALAAGAVSVLAARVVSYRYLSEQSFYSAEFYGVSGAFIGVIVLALVIALMFRFVLKLTGQVRGRAEFAGLAGMALFEHMAILKAPQLFASLYSADYVAEVVARMG